jgi:hypothetical protein
MDDAVGAAEDRLQIVPLDVGTPPFRLRSVTVRSPPGQPDDRVDLVVVCERPQEARADVAARAGDDYAHQGFKTTLK